MKLGAARSATKGETIAEGLSPPAGVEPLSKSFGSFRRTCRRSRMAIVLTPMAPFGPSPAITAPAQSSL